ncbi:MAG: transporter [Chthoniobacterales bacterium]
MSKVSAVALWMAGSVSVIAQSAVSPAPQLREMNALFLSPYTVNTGHVQVESYVVGYAYGRDRRAGGDTRTSSWNIAPTTFKYGALDNLDFELEISPYTSVRTNDRVARSVQRQSGFGDIRVNAKLNLWGNDSGSSAVALLPSIKFPTAQNGLGNDTFEGGLAIPIALELPRDWWLFFSPGLSVVQKGNATGYTAAFGDTASLWHQLVGDLSAYVEFANDIGFDAPEQWYGTVDLGCTYMLGHNVQLDAGVLLGVTRTAPDVNPFLGLSFRF